MVGTGGLRWLVAISCVLCSRVLAQGVLNVGGVFPLLNADDSVNVVGALRQAAFVLAVKEINDKNDGIFDDILPNVVVKMACRDSLRTFSNTVLAGIDLTQNQFAPYGVQAVVGAGDNSVSEALATLLGGTDVMQISYGSSATDLSHSDVYPTFLRDFPSDAFQGTAMLDILNKAYKFKRVTVFASSDTLGADSLYEFTILAGQQGVEVSHQSTIPTGLTDYSAIINEAKQYDCRAFAFLMSNPSDASRLLVQGTDAGLFTSQTTLFFSIALMVPQTYSAVVAKYGTGALRGAFALQPMIQQWKLTPNGKTFIARYLAQTNTYTVAANGSQVCSYAKDDTGNYLYQVNVKGKAVCTGVLFNTYKPDGSDASTYMGFVYDATMAVFHAIDFLIKSGTITPSQLNTQHLSGRMLKSVLVNNVSFVGATGQIDFSHGRAGSKVYGYGDRAVGNGYVVWNWHYNATFGGFKRVARWTTEDSYKRCDEDWFYPPVWMGGCNLPVQFASSDLVSLPPDRRPDVLQVVSPAALGLAAALAAIEGFIAVFLLVVLFLVKAKTRMVKASQPAMMLFIVFGVALGTVRIALAGVNPTNGVCHANVWFGHTCFACVFTAMIVKAWRVLMIVSGGLRKVKITTTQVVRYTIALVCIPVVILVLYSAIGNPHVAYIVVPLVTGNNLLKPYCTTTMPGFDSALYAVEAVALAVATYLCYRTKDTPDAVNESKFIALAVFLIVFVAIAGLPIVLSLPLDPYVTQMVVALCFFFGLTGGNGFYFGQKLYYLLQGGDFNAQFKIVYKNGKQAQSESMRIRQEKSLKDSQVDEDNDVDGTMKGIKADVRQAFLERDVPPDCDVAYAQERIVLWIAHRTTLERKLFDNSSESKGSRATVVAQLVAKARRSISSQNGSDGERASQVKDNSVYCDNTAPSSISASATGRDEAAAMHAMLKQKRESAPSSVVSEVVAGGGAPKRDSLASTSEAK